MSFGLHDIIDHVNLGGTSAALISPAGAIAPFGFATRVGVLQYTGPGSSALFISAGDSVTI